MADEAAAVESSVEPVAAPAPRVHARVRAGLRKPANWLQLVRFALVGASGYAVNLAVFSSCVAIAGMGHRPAAVLAFVVALCNNFAWNRRWTFAAHKGHAGAQMARFCVVSIGAFLFAFAVLELLVAGIGVPEVPALAIAIATATPLNFVGNKLWSFDR
jgi:putative flippase GtrA